MMDLSTKYTYCKAAEISSDMLLKGADFPRIECVKKGLILELLQIQKSAGTIPWEKFAQWVQLLFQLDDPPSVWALRRSVVALPSKKLKLQKVVTKQPELEVLLEEPFQLPESRSRNATTSHAKQPAQSTFMQQAISLVNKSLASDVIQLEQKCNEKERQLRSKEYDCEKLEAKLRDYKPHNVKRRLQRKIDRIAEQKGIIQQLKKDLRQKRQKDTKKSQSKVKYYKDKCQKLKTNLQDFENECSHCNDLEREVKALRDRNIELLEANAQLLETINELQSRKITTYTDGRYTDSMRVCVMELLSHNVGIRQVEPVIEAVLKLCKVECDRLPQHTAINEMLIESRSLAHIQLADALTQSQHNTLHSDGTTKFGHKYTGYQVATHTGVLTLGIQEVTSGSAEVALETLQEILDELSEASLKSGYSDAGKKIVANIKSTMSDRAQVQKSFNEMLAAYRAKILPTVIEDWSDFNEMEQQTMSQMYHFFCGMHIVVNMAEHASESLKLFENALSDSEAQEGEAGTIRLIRTACKAFEKRGDEKSGYPLQFTTYLKKQGIDANPFIHFRGNRFNVVFANGGRVYYLREHIINFLTKTWGTPNRLLKAVLEDATNNPYIAGCKALGLIDKFITGPLWRILESDIHILDLSDYYTKLLSFLENCKDASEFMTGENIPFPDTPVKKDALWTALVTPSSHDPQVEQMLLAIFKTTELLLQRVINDHLPTRKAVDRNESARSETVTVKKTNTTSERDFAKLDRLLREKPHARTLALEAHILFLNNKTAAWLATKTESELNKILTAARQLVPQHKSKFKQRLASIEQARIITQQQKEEQKQQAEVRLLLQKERLTSEIIQYGLWQSIDQMDKALQVIPSKTNKVKALKTQLRFRKTVLQQSYPSDKDVYKFSSKQVGNFTPEKLRENLGKLIQTASREENAADSPENIAATDFDLVGKRIDQQFNEGGKLVTYSGVVVSQVPGFIEWYNVVYDDEPETVFTYKLLDDMKNGDLKVL